MFLVLWQNVLQKGRPVLAASGWLARDISAMQISQNVSLMAACSRAGIDSTTTHVILAWFDSVPQGFLCWSQTDLSFDRTNLNTKNNQRILTVVDCTVTWHQTYWTIIFSGLKTSILWHPKMLGVKSCRDTWVSKFAQTWSECCHKSKKGDISNKAFWHSFNF